ncbi:linker histone H1M [Nothobranchius furzeri]|uniref:Protein B4 n=1 Tax=Nothobranchius furzeri TaxID=105023 RepID=A0A9D3BFA2_NOTFU|nr:protein B4 [Nothobranchius furzeri]
MPPKKRAADSANPEPTLSKVSAEETAGTEKSGAAAVRKRTHPTTAAMVREALKDLDSRKGVSSQAIQSFIKQKYPSADGVRLKYLIRTALKRGMETGTLVRPVNPSVTSGALRKFRLAPEKQPKAKTENTNPNVQKAPKAAKDGVKKTEKAGSTKKSSAKDESAENMKPSRKSKKAAEAASSNVPKAAKDGVNQIQSAGVPKKNFSEVESAEDIKLSMKPKKAGESAPLKVVPAKKPKAKQSSEGNSDSTKSQATKDIKLPRKSKKAGESASLKVVPAKKPKVKQSSEENSDLTKSQATKVTKDEKTGKAAQSKAAEAHNDDPAPKAAGKRGKKME